MLSSICFMPASLTPQSLPPGSPTMAMYLSDSTVVMCMRAGLYQTKNGLLVFLGSLPASLSGLVAFRPRLRTKRTAGRHLLRRSRARSGAEHRNAIYWA